MLDRPLILAVDDERDFLEIASAYLESSGFRAATFLTTEAGEFLKHCEELKPDLALLDVYLQGRPLGVELAAALKNNPPTADIKVILWSAASKPAESSADDFFNKGEDLKILVDKIRQHVPGVGTRSS